MKIALKVLFTKVEMFLIRNNRKFLIETDKSDGRSSLEKARVSKKQELGLNFKKLLDETGIPNQSKREEFSAFY